MIKTKAGKSKGFILVVEDEEIYAELLRKKLVKENYVVEVVGNGKSAMKLLKHKQPDLVLLDLVLPVMDGFELLKKIRKDKTLTNLRVIVLSNLGQDVDIERAENLGVVDFVVKTNISLKNMIEKIRKEVLP